jgi:hypothetical protein
MTSDVTRGSSGGWIRKADAETNISHMGREQRGSRGSSGGWIRKAEQEANIWNIADDDNAASRRLS